MAKKKTMAIDYYNTKLIRSKDAHYNLVIGERSNGKTTALLRDIIEDYYLTGSKGAVVRQMELDIKGHKGASLFSGVVAGNMVAELTNGEWDGIRYWNRAYYLTRWDDVKAKEVRDTDAFCHIFAISQAIHYKSNSYPNIGTIMFDEFMRADHVYLPDEVSQFLNLVSTLVRDKNDAKIFLVANTISWNSQYFKKLGLTSVSKMKPGELAVVEKKKKRSGGVELEMRVAIEYCENTAEYGGKASDVYFLMDDATTSMIIDGEFAIPDYPRCPHHFTERNIKCTYWILPEDSPVIRCRLIKLDRQLFIFADEVDDVVYEKIADQRRDLFYDLSYSGLVNHFTAIDHYADTRTSYLANAFAANRVFFSSNDCGENLIYYFNEAANKSILKNS